MWVNCKLCRAHFHLYRGADKSLVRPGKKNLIFLSEWREFPSAPCLAGRRKETWWQLASRCCWNRARPLHASELVSFLVGVRTYQHPDTCSVGMSGCLQDLVKSLLVTVRSGQTSRGVHPSIARGTSMNWSRSRQKKLQHNWWEWREPL